MRKKIQHPFFGEMLLITSLELLHTSGYYSRARIMYGSYASIKKVMNIWNQDTKVILWKRD